MNINRELLKKMYENTGEGKIFERDFVLTNEMRYEMLKISAKINMEILRTKDSYDWIEFLRLEHEGLQKGVLPFCFEWMPPIWMKIGSSVKKVKEGGYRIEVTNDVYYTFFWTKVVESLQGIAIKSKKLLRKTKTKHMNDLLKFSSQFFKEKGIKD